MRSILLTMMVSFSLLAAAEITCETVHSGIKKIRCTYSCQPFNKPRNVTFSWISPDNKADNFTKVYTLLAGQVSVVDSRYFAGRSEGKWAISVSDESTNESVSTEYIKNSYEKVFPEQRKHL